MDADDVVESGPSGHESSPSEPVRGSTPGRAHRVLAYMVSERGDHAAAAQLLRDNLSHGLPDLSEIVEG